MKDQVVEDAEKKRLAVKALASIAFKAGRHWLKCAGTRPSRWTSNRAASGAGGASIQKHRTFLFVFQAPLQGLFFFHFSGGIFAGSNSWKPRRTWEGKNLLHWLNYLVAVVSMFLGEMSLWCCSHHENEAQPEFLFTSAFLKGPEFSTFSLTLKFERFKYLGIQEGVSEALPSGCENLQKPCWIYFSWPTTSCFRLLFLKSYCAVLSSVWDTLQPSVGRR